MKCVKCEADLHYGDKYCNICGEKVEKGAYEEDYKKTIWGKLDKWGDKWETFTLRKFIDHWVTKVIVLILVLGWGIFDAYTDLTNIKFLESESYMIEYNKKADEYYIRTAEDEVDLELYIPRHSEKITVKEFIGEDEINVREMLPEEYQKEAVKVKKGEFDYVTVSSIKGDKVTDTVKVYVIDR